MRRLLRTLTVAVALLAGRTLRAQSAGYVVIVNAANPAAELPRDLVSRLFLKKTKRWSTGQPVLPVDLAESARVREAFSEAVHGKGVAAVKSYWEQQIFSGREVPPSEKGSEAEVLALVRANPNAIGYVSADRDLKGVKVLAVR